MYISRPAREVCSHRWQVTRGIRALLPTLYLFTMVQGLDCPGVKESRSNIHRWHAGPGRSCPETPATASPEESHPGGR